MSGPWNLDGREPSGQQRPGQAPPPSEQQGYGQHQYFQMAPMPGEPQLAPRPMPREVRTSFWLWVATIVLGVVGAVVMLVTLDDNAGRELRGVGMSDGDAAMFTRVAAVASASFTLLWAGLKVFFVLMMRAGRSWSRIVLTVYGPLSVLFSIGALVADDRTAVRSSISAAGILLTVAAVVLMYLGAAGSWFSRPRS